MAVELRNIWNDWDWKAAEEELNIAAALEPNNPDIMRLAEQRNLKGEGRDAIRFWRRLRQSSSQL
jgi:hypothetical protein